MIKVGTDNIFNRNGLCSICNTYRERNRMMIPLLIDSMPASIYAKFLRKDFVLEHDPSYGGTGTPMGWIPTMGAGSPAFVNNGGQITPMKSPTGPTFKQSVSLNELLKLFDISGLNLSVTDLATGEEFEANYVFDACPKCALRFMHKFCKSGLPKLKEAMRKYNKPEHLVDTIINQDREFVATTNYHNPKNIRKYIGVATNYVKQKWFKIGGTGK